MSTWIYLVCENHNPPLVADDASGQHLYDLPQIRADLADRERVVEQWEGGEFDRGDLGYFRRNTARFLALHPLCSIGIRDEYGRAHPAVEVAGNEGL